MFKSYRQIFFQELPYKEIKSYHVVPGDSSGCKILVTYKKKLSISYALYDMSMNESREYSLKIKSVSQKFTIAVSGNYFSVTQDSNIYFNKIDDFQQFSR